MLKNRLRPNNESTFSSSSFSHALVHAQFLKQQSALYLRRLKDYGAILLQSINALCCEVKEKERKKKLLIASSIFITTRL